MMGKIVRLCMSSIVSVALCGSLRGDTIKFKDGTEIQGRIVAEMGDMVMIQFQGSSGKVSKDSILKIIKGDMPKVEYKQRKKRFRISDMKDVPLAEIESDLDLWFKKLGPAHAKSKKELRAVIVARMTGKKDGVFLWLPKWCGGGFSAMCLDDIQDTLRMLYGIRNSFKRIIRDTAQAKDCSACHGTQRSICRKCRGTGKVSAGTSISYSVGRSGVTSKQKIKTSKCRECRGSGRTPCSAVHHISEKQVKEMGGVEKTVELSLLASKHHDRLLKINAKMTKTKYSRGLMEISRELYCNGYYYMALEILKQIKEKEKK